MRSKGSRFTLGVWRLRVCSLGVAFTAATVRNRPCEDRMAVPMVSSAEVVIFGYFWRFPTFRCFVSRGRRGTSWHSGVFSNVSKVVLCGRRNTFATFSEDVLHFSWQPREVAMGVPMVSSATGVTFGGFKRRVASFRVAGVALRDIQTCFVSRRKCFVWQAQHFGRVHRHFSWQAQHFRRVVLRVYCKSHWQGCVKWRQGANSVAGVAFGAMCWKLTEASHETSILRLQIFRF